LVARREAYYGRPAEGEEPQAAVDPAPAEPSLSVGDQALQPQRRVNRTHRFAEGQRVRHAIFGEGEIISTRLTGGEEEVTVAFPGQGIKKLMASLAGLEVLPTGE
jgi:DNA helicase-2/ATP-dependent DNA helicase PcrA